MGRHEVLLDGLTPGFLFPHEMDRGWLRLQNFLQPLPEVPQTGAGRNDPGQTDPKKEDDTNIGRVVTGCASDEGDKGAIVKDDPNESWYGEKDKPHNRTADNGQNIRAFLSDDDSGGGEAGDRDDENTDEAQDDRQRTQALENQDGDAHQEEEFEIEEI